MHNITYKPITIAPVLAAVIAMMGATTSVHASVDCSLSNDSRCLQATMLPPDQIQFHHSNITAYCLFGVLLGTWNYPANASNIGSTAYCRSIPWSQRYFQFQGYCWQLLLMSLQLVYPLFSSNVTRTWCGSSRSTIYQYNAACLKNSPISPGQSLI